MSLQELSKGSPDDISGSIPKYVFDCQSKKTIHKATAYGWLDNISYIQTLNDIGALTMQYRNHKQILEGILEGNKKIVIKVSNEIDIVEKEYQNFNILMQNNIQGVLDCYCFFIIEDFNKTIRTDGLDMKVLIMEYVDDGSFGLYTWKDTDIDIIKSCIKQLVCTLVDAYIKIGFVHFDLNYNNYLLKRTKKKECSYIINGKEFIVSIPKNGFETVLMDFEDCEINQDTEIFIKSLDKLFNRIKEIDTIYDIWKHYSLMISKLLNNLYELSDKSVNIDIAMRVLDIIDML